MRPESLPLHIPAKFRAILVAGYRKMTAMQKLERVQALTQAVQELALMDVRRHHAEASERELALRVASRSMDRELMIRAFGWDPEVEGY